jgi:hypothetical protein
MSAMPVSHVAFVPETVTQHPPLFIQVPSKAFEAIELGPVSAAGFAGAAGSTGIDALFGGTSVSTTTLPVLASIGIAVISAESKSLVA